MSKFGVRVDAAVSALGGGAGAALDENDFIDASRLVYDAVREIRRAVLMNRVSWGEREIERGGGRVMCVIILQLFTVSLRVQKLVILKVLTVSERSLFFFIIKCPKAYLDDVDARNVIQVAKHCYSNRSE